jgi:heterotetrameric sarcosine oxidase delta subunit
VSFLLHCPNCGPRDVAEFRYGGEIVEGDRSSPGSRGSNLPGPQRERWYHRFGCRGWLLVERDVRTNAILYTGWLGQEGS